MKIAYTKAGNTRLERTADLREKVQHILKSTSMKQQENPADFSSVHKVQAFFAQICCHFTPCISRFTPTYTSNYSCRKSTREIQIHIGPTSSDNFTFFWQTILLHTKM